MPAARGWPVAPRCRPALRYRRRPEGECTGLIVPVWLPGKAARAFRASANLAPEQAVDHRTWEDFLAERVGSTGQAAR